MGGTVVVLGASYGGNRAAQMLAAGLPSGWRIVLVDRNTHFNHVYVLPRLAVLPGHEHKAFIPYTRVFHKSTAPLPPDSPHIRIHTHVISVHPTHVVLSKSFPEHGIPTRELRFDYLVYALGSHLPEPLNLWGTHSVKGVATMPVEVSETLELPLPATSESSSASASPIPSTSTSNAPTPSSSSSSLPDSQTIEAHLSQLATKLSYTGTKADGISWLKRNQSTVSAARSVLVVGGGALGVQFATDIASIYPEKKVTLLHSRHRLMPRFDEELHLEVLKGLESNNVNVILGERLDLNYPPKVNERGEKVARTLKGREVEADLLLLCTGQIPNTAMLKAMDPRTVNESDGLAHVLRSMQLGVLPTLPPSPTLARPSTPPLNMASRKGKEPMTPLMPLTPRAPEQEDDLKAALEKIALSYNQPSSSSNPSSGSGSPAESTFSDDLDTEEFDDSSVFPDELDEDENEEISEKEEEKETTPYPHIFAIGDTADAFGAIPAGHTAYWQGEVAGRNIVKLVRAREENDGEEVELEEYRPGPPAIKVSLGLTKSAFQANGVVGVKTDGVEDLNVRVIWKSWGYVDGNAEEDDRTFYL